MTREQAIEIVKTQYSHDAVMKTALGTLIPELCESSDEIILSAMIKGFNFLMVKREINIFAGIPIRNILAYLEKKKEQKSILKFRIGDTIRKKTQPTWIKQITSIFEDKTYITGTGTDAYGIKVSEQDDWELVEQKPAEWSEEDKRALNDAIVTLSEYVYGKIPHILPSMLLKTIERLKSLRPKPHWKPTECQMDSLREIADSLPEGTNLKYLEEVIYALDQQKYDI